MGVVNQIIKAENNVDQLQDNVEQLQNRLSIASGIAFTVWTALQNEADTAQTERAMLGVCESMNKIIEDMDALVEDILEIKRVFNN